MTTKLKLSQKMLEELDGFDAALNRVGAQFEVEPGDVTWTQFRMVMGETMDPEDIRSWQNTFNGLGGFQKVRDAYLDPKVTERKVERHVVATAASASKKVVKSAAEDQLYLRDLESVLATVTKVPPVRPFKVPKAQVGKGKPAIANILLSDMHFGSDLKAKEGFMPYGFVEEARCMASIVKRVCEYKPSHRAYTDLNVYLAGDLIRGKIHDREYCMPMALQTGDALYLLLQAIRVWAANYKKVTVRCVGGNHDRSPDSHPHKAISGRVDSEATKIYWALKLALQEQENVEVIIPSTQYHSFEIFGERVYLGHGDINLNPGYPGSKINVSSLEKQINNLNVGAVSRGDKPFRLFMVGHVHVGSLVHLPMGDLITNGTLQPSDPFGQSIGYYSSARGQVMFESVPEHIVGDYRFLSVDASTHADATLDKIIRPFTGEF